MSISYAEYLQKLRLFVSDNLQKENNQPIGMYSAWAYWSQKKKQFDKQLKEQNITVDKE